jgi:hypothetical protein
MLLESMNEQNVLNSLCPFFSLGLPFAHIFYMENHFPF